MEAERHAIRRRYMSGNATTWCHQGLRFQIGRRLLAALSTGPLGRLPIRKRGAFAKRAWKMAHDMGKQEACKQ